jgi:glycosyltransferase involved in cell wall biosynthesis
VIGGNMDGSTEPLCNGKLGTLIDPHNISSIEEALIKNLNDKKKYLPNRELLMSAFSFETYKSNWVELLNSSVKLS